MDQTLAAVLTFIRDVGIPAGVLVWIGWFVQTRAWPDFISTQQLQSQAMIALAEAIEACTANLKS